jgi:hypothetical protein
VPRRLTPSSIAALVLPCLSKYVVGIAIEPDGVEADIG